MRFPLVGVASAVAAALGGYGFYWYQNLSKSEQEEADRLGVERARQLFGRFPIRPQLGGGGELIKERFED